MGASWQLMKLQGRIVRRDPAFLVIFFFMPLVVMPLMHRTMGLSLVGSGFAGASGAEVVVPGQVVLFGFFIAGSVGFAIYREHGWKTWERLRASATPPGWILAGIAAPWVVIHLLYQAALFVAGALLLDLRPLEPENWLGLALIMVANAVASVALMTYISVLLSSIQQVNAVQNVGAMVFGGLGGALAPFEQLPGWAQAVGRFTPAYWAMRGFRSMLLPQEGAVTVLLVSAAVLMGVGLVSTVAAVRRFRLEDSKEFFV